MNGSHDCSSNRVLRARVLTARVFTARVLTAILVATAAATMPAACGSEDDAAPRADEVGRVALPLLTQANDHTYRLRGVFIVISGPEYAQLSDSGTSQTALSATLATGAYTAHLFSGWTLEREDGAGQFTPVNASLVSSPSVAFTIFNGATSTVAYGFQTDGVIVTVGSGQLRVTANVDEIGAACTPFGADCGAGTWCPPTTLTGMARACMPEGAIPVGAACASPRECVANASCFDLGAGPVCAPLCPPSQFDLPCDAGGTCEAMDAEYGVCRPAAGAP